MTDFETIEPVIQRICDSAADALRRFFKLTDFPPDWMHESFMASYVFHRLGNEISMMPEVKVSTLWEWNRSTTNGPPQPLPDENLGQKIRGQRRVDLVVFRPWNIPKNQQHIWCLIEFKRNAEVGSDICKLKPLLPLFVGCEFGAACGVADTDKWGDWLLEEPKTALARGERFLTCQQPWRTPDEARSFTVFAYVFPA
ncbi:MAG TPA: hypothetical protein VMF86_03650 [Stellaceae bacterium]|nr:hypothetical protein [Stellaceae bacterium]